MSQTQHANNSPKEGIINDRFAPLRLPHFRYFVLMRFAAVMAIMMQATLISWQVYDITHDPLDLGLLGLAEVIPALSVALFGGYLADKLPRKRVMRLGILAFFSISLALIALTWNREYFYNSRQVWPWFAVMGAAGFFRGFLGPTFVATQGQLVPRPMLQSAISWITTFWNIGAIAGPAVGGLLFGWQGALLTYAIVAGLFLVSLVATWGFAVPAQEPMNTTETIFDSLSAGIRFVFSNRILLSALLLDMFAVLFGGATALLPIFANEILNVGPQGLGFLRAAPSVGAIAISAYLALRKPMRRAGVVMLYCVAAFGLCTIAFALSQNFYLSLVLLVLMGLADGVSVVIRSTILQLYTPDAMRGRVASVNTIFITSSNEIGAFESGVAARLMGTVASVVFGGAMSLAIVVVAALRAPALRRLNLREPEPAITPPA